MPIRLHHGDVLDAHSEALLFTVSPDGIAAIRSGKGIDRILGNVARQFRRRWPEAWEEVERALLEAQAEGELKLLSPGGTHFVTLDEPDCPFEGLELISTLSHDSAADQRALAVRGLRRGLEELLAEGIMDIATTLPAGGWRLGQDTAFRVLGQGLRGALTTLPKEERINVELRLWVMDVETKERLELLLHSL